MVMKVLLRADCRPGGRWQEAATYERLCLGCLIHFIGTRFETRKAMNLYLTRAITTKVAKPNRVWWEDGFAGNF